MTPKTPAPERTCRRCGCTAARACVTEFGPCHWVAADLCSECAEREGRPAAGTLPVRLNDRDVRKLAAVRTVVELNGVTALQLLAVLQMACRHPQFRGATRATAENFGRGLQRAISVTPHLAALAEAGWRPDFDVPAAGAEGEP